MASTHRRLKFDYKAEARIEIENERDWTTLKLTKSTYHYVADILSLQL